jgi:hypothetical protein
MVLRLQTDVDASFGFSTSTYVSPSYFPSSADSEPLVHAFVSGERLEEFVTEYLNEIVKVLTPEISLESPQPSARFLYPPSLRLHHELILSIALSMALSRDVSLTRRQTLDETPHARPPHRL